MKKCLQHFGTDYKEINHINAPKFKTFFGDSFSSEV